MDTANMLKEFLADVESVDSSSYCSEIYEHSDRESSDEQNPVSTVESTSRTCSYFYNYGYCKFGNSCKFKHIKKRTLNDKYVFKEGKLPLSKNVHEQKSIENEKFRNSDKQMFSKSNCRYFKMGSCKKGDSCEFYHSVQHINKKMSTLNVSLQSQNFSKKTFANTAGSSKRRTAPLCYYFKKGLCYKGENCKYYHQTRTNFYSSESFSNSNAKINANNSFSPNVNVMDRTKSSNVEKSVPVIINRTSNVYDLSSVTIDDIAQLRSTEINQLKKRFPHFDVIAENKTYSVLFEPSDPDWAFDVNKLKLEVDFPVNYPTEKCKITIIQNAENIPHLLINYLNKAVCDWINKKCEENSASNKTELIFRPFLKWFDKNLEDLFITGLRKVKQDLKAKEDGIEFVPAEKLFSSSPKHSAENVFSSPEKIEETCSENNAAVVNCSQLQEQSSASDVKVSSQANQNNKSVYNSSNDGMKILFTELQFIEGAAAFMCTKISATLQCSRCKTSFNVKSVSKKSNSHVCLKCSKNVGFTFEPSTIHEFSSVLGTIHLLNCVAVDINLVECHFLVDCLNCSKQVPVDGIHYGQKHKMWCTFCSEKMMMSIGSVKFQTLRLTSAPVSKYPLPKKIEKKFKDPVVKEGEPLPNFGACKHYKKSFRWLRFPCCGRLYPCDECHNEKEPGHEMKYASRMLCGFCAKEQPYSKEKPCILCSQSLTKKSGSHWEGGRGCRNRIQMCREDKQKYTGVSKTISRKAQVNKPKKK